MPYDNHYKEFTNEIDVLARRFDLPRVFDDFLTMGVCSYHQTNIASRLTVKDEENEVLYMQTIKPYKKDELNRFAKLLGIVQLSIYEDPYSDLLGKYFTEHITNGRNGQYFTPSPVAQLIAQLTRNEEVKGQRIYDPACGSGGLLLEFARVSPNNYFYANDVSMTCSKMTSLNFLFNGLRGEVACMNTLSMEWVKGWRINIPGIGIKPISKEDSQIWSAPPPSKSTEQLTLF